MRFDVLVVMTGVGGNDWR